MKYSVKNRALPLLTAFALVLCSCLSPACGTAAYSSADGAINQYVSHADEAGMYLYNLSLSVTNPCNSKDMDKDAVNSLKFTFTYAADNGCGSKGTYVLDMSWNKDKNRNADLLKKHFIRPDDNSYQTGMSVWVPGIVTKIQVHLNMDGGERLKFAVRGVYLNGFRGDVNTDYVSSAYYDSDATVNCVFPNARIIPSEGVLRDQFGAPAGEKLISLYEQNPAKYTYGY